jgi:LysR family cyn operon transcriptional activator
MIDAFKVLAMNFRNLRTFIAVVDAGGLHRAAARLNLSQPAASRQIQALEAEVGMPLFDRIGRRVQLTSAGEDLLERGRRLLAEVNAFTERAGALKKGDSGILRVGATPMVIENTLAPFLSQYRRGHPGVEVQLLEDGGVRLPDRLNEGHVHLALTVVVDDRFRHQPLYPACAVAVVSKRHRLSQYRSLEIEELTNEPLLLLHRTFGSRDWVDTACKIAHIKPLILLESGAPHTIVALAGAGYGIAVVPSTVIIPRGSVCGIPLKHRGMTIGRWLTVAWDPQRSVAAYAEQFTKVLVAYCQRRYPGSEFTQQAPPLPRPKQPVR